VLVNERPQTGLEAKFSEHFAMAAAVMLGHMTIEDLTDAVVRRADIQAFFPKVKLDPVDEYDARDPAHSPSERVVIRLVNGETLDTGASTNVRGHALDPLTPEELWEKFRDCTRKTHDESEARALFERTRALAHLSSTEDLPTATRLFSRDGEARHG
jgi:2-methylcitrate dehydratase PrpD